jgi:hypothetical protein
MARDQEPGGPYLEAIQRAFQFARVHGRDCDPADFLVGLAAGSGPAAAALDPRSGRSAAPRPRRPRRLRHGITVGWSAWFDNRRVSLRGRWFRLRTSRNYRGCPQP